MPSSITDNPEAFFEELNKPQKEEAAVEVSPVAPVAVPVTTPLTGNTEPAKEEPKAKEVSVTDNPEAFFAGLTKPVEVKEEKPQDLVLSQLAGKTGAQMDDFDMQSLDLLSPKELEEVTNTRKDIPLTENLLRTKFDYEMSLPWNEGVNTLENWKKIGQEVFGGGVSFLKGAQKFAEQSLFAEADQDPSGFGHPSFKPIKDYASGITALPESAAYLFTKLKEGGIGLKDRLSESLGMQDREKSYENYKARNLVDRIQTQEMQENPSIYSRILKGDMANDALAYVVLNTLPDRETLMAQEGLTAEQADSKRKEIANAIARQTTSDIASREKPADEDIATFATFTAPAGLALGEMGLVSLGLEAGMGLTPKIAQGIKYLGKTDQEIKAMNDAAQTLQKEGALSDLEKAQKPSMLGRASGALATGIEKAEAASARIGEATPKILKELAPPAAGALIAGGDHRGEGAVLGAILGKAGKPALAALKYAAKTPALIRDIEEARVLAAGGSKGTFETLASFPEVSENAAKILRFGGKRLDTTLNNVVEYAKAGVNPTLIALATGALESSSPEELNKLTSTGLLYGLGGRVVHQAWGKITGVDPIIDARNRRQQDIDDLKTYRDLDPETRKTLDSVTSWDNIVERHTQRAINAEQAYNDAVALGKKDAEQLGKVAQAERNILSAVNRANVQTRDEFSRQFVTQLTKLNQLVNGTLRAGQNNVGINILTPEQIVAKFRSDPANATATDQELLDVASQRGFYSTPEGSVEYQVGMSMDAPKKKIVFDRTKPSVVINADALKARMMIEGSTPIDALNHEAGHHVRNIPEFREANKDAERLLFSQEVRDLSGKIVDVTTGQYSEKALVEMYKNDYLKDKTPDEVTKLSQLAGLWDYSRGALNEGAVAEYMRDEIISELNAETFSTRLGKDLDNGVLYMLDVARLKTKKNLLDRAVQKFFGLGGKGEATSDLTGATFSPEVLAANRQAIRALQSLQGEVSQAVKAVESPKISRAEMLKSKALMDRHGKYAGLFKTKMQGQVFDGNGNPIGSPIDITNPNASEGSWESRNGETKQLNGYGARPDEVAESAGVVIPDGGRLVVQKQIVTQPDGVTPVMMEPKEAKDLQKARAQVIRESLNTPDEGAPNRFEAVNDDSETWRGTFTPLQIQAIKDMPEGIIPKAIKEHMLKINDMIVRGDGGRMLVDYAAVMNDAGKYTAYSPKIYDVVPIGMHLSGAGNFLVTTISVGRMFDKLNAWSERMPARLAPWGGSKDAFFKEFTETYLQNWQYREKDDKGNEMFPRGKAGETGISGSPEEALAKKDIFNDFLNLTTNDFRGTNADRTNTPRRRGDVRGKNIDRTIMSMRLDHMAELMDNDSAPKVPINYKNAISNFMPAEETAPAQEERRPTPFDGITAEYNPQGRAFGAKYVSPQREGETKDDYVNRIMTDREDRLNAENPDTLYTPLAGSQYDYMEGSSRAGRNDISFMPNSEEKKEEIKSALEDLSRNDLEDSEVFTNDLPNINDDSLSYVDTIGGIKQDNGYRYGGIQLYVRDSSSGDSGIRDYGSHELFFYDNQDNPIGFARLTKDPKKASISMIAFTEENRGQGNGTAFYKYLLDDLGVSVVSDTEITSGTKSIYEKLLKDYNADVTNDGTIEIKSNISFMPKSEAREEERTERLPASGAELTASLIASGTSLESFGKDTLIQLAESYGIELPEGAKRGEIIDAINANTTAETKVKSIKLSGFGSKDSEAGSRLVDSIEKETEENQLDPTERIVNRNSAIDVEDNGSEARIRSIRSFERGKGAGREALNLIITLADQEGVPLVLDAKRFTSEGLTNKQLKDWYARSGFVEQKDGSMRREPSEAPTEEPVTENSKSITRQYGKYPKGTRVVVVGQRSKDPLNTNIPVQFPDGKVEKFPINWLKSNSAQGQSSNLPKLVKDQGRDAVNILLGEWDQNAMLNPDGTGIISVVNPRESMKKTKVPISDFTEWLKGQDIEAILVSQGEEPVKFVSDIRFMPAAKLDETYSKAIESGDMEEAQRLVTEKARQAGYDITAYHGSPNKPFWVFDPAKKGERTGSNSALLGYFASSDANVSKAYRMTNVEKARAGEVGPLGFNIEDAERNSAIDEDIEISAEYDEEEKGWIARAKTYDNYGSEYNYDVDRFIYDEEQEAIDAGEEHKEEKIKKSQKVLADKWAEYEKAAKEIESKGTLHNLYLNLKDPLVYDFNGGDFRDKSYTELVNEAVEEGHDGVIMRNTNDDPNGEVESDVYVFFNSSQAKLADPATYDNEGKLIPLSQRFDTSKQDIRFMPETEMQEPTKIDWSVFIQEAQKPLSTLRAYANPQQQDEVN